MSCNKIIDKGEGWTLFTRGGEYPPKLFLSVDQRERDGSNVPNVTRITWTMSLAIKNYIDKLLFVEKEVRENGLSSQTKRDSNMSGSVPIYGDNGGWVYEDAHVSSEISSCPHCGQVMPSRDTLRASALEKLELSVLTPAERSALGLE